MNLNLMAFGPRRTGWLFFRISRSSSRMRFSRQSRTFSRARLKSSFDTTSVPRCAGHCYRQCCGQQHLQHLRHPRADRADPSAGGPGRHFRVRSIDHAGSNTGTCGSRARARKAVTARRGAVFGRIRQLHCKPRQVSLRRKRPRSLLRGLPMRCQ